VVASLEEWQDRRPSYRDQLADMSNVVAMTAASIQETLDAWDTQSAPDRQDVTALWHTMNSQGQELLAASIVLAASLQLPARFLPRPLRAIVEILGIELPSQLPRERGSYLRLRSPS
jgi:hypothetical protein